jgi:hypothetical protein
VKGLLDQLEALVCRSAMRDEIFEIDFLEFWNRGNIQLRSAGW